MHSVTNIQKYSIHDGDGIRTTVFFKGCHLRCRWCHNPETQSFEKELQVDVPKCTGCGRCAGACPEGAIIITPGYSDYFRNLDEELQNEIINRTAQSF